MLSSRPAHVLSVCFAYSPQLSCYYESERFSSVWNSLQYDLILLTGDYPLIDFTLLGRYINFVQVPYTVPPSDVFLLHHFPLQFDCPIAQTRDRGIGHPVSTRPRNSKMSCKYRLLSCLRFGSNFETRSYFCFQSKQEI